VSGVATIRVIVGSEGDKLEGMVLAGGSGTFAAGGFAAGRGPEFGFFLVPYKLICVQNAHKIFFKLSMLPLDRG